VKPPRAFARGFPVRKKNIFYIAPLDPALPDGACGEQAGQGLTPIIFLLLFNWDVTPGPFVNMEM